MPTTHSVFVASVIALAGCGSRFPEPKDRASPAKGFDVPKPDAAYRPQSMPWWHGAMPKCSAGQLKSHSVAWGAVYWCELSGHAVDASLQNDVGRIAHCVHDAVLAFHSEPGPEGLREFLGRADVEGISPLLCKVVRRDDEVRTYNGRIIELERVLAAPAAEDGMFDIRYRFSCQGCLVASETVVKVKI